MNFKDMCRPATVALVLLVLAVPTASLACDRTEVGHTKVTGMDTMPYRGHSADGTEVLPELEVGLLLEAGVNHLHVPEPVMRMIASLEFQGEQQLGIYGRFPWVNLWIRRFAGREGERDGVALSMELGCDHLRSMAHERGGTWIDGERYSPLTGCQWLRTLPAGRLTTGLRLFLVNTDGTLEPVVEVPGVIFPKINDAMMRHLQQQGISPAYLEPVGRPPGRHMQVLMEPDPDRSIPLDTPGYDIDAYLVYGGHLAWTGAGFQIQHPVSEIWPE